jgi:hypothetical protein
MWVLLAEERNKNPAKTSYLKKIARICWLSSPGIIA